MLQCSCNYTHSLVTRRYETSLTEDWIGSLHQEATVAIIFIFIFMRVILSFDFASVNFSGIPSVRWLQRDIYFSHFFSLATDLAATWLLGYLDRPRESAGQVALFGRQCLDTRPAAGYWCFKTKYPGVWKFRAISTVLKVFEICLELQSDSEKYFGFVVDEFSELVHTGKSWCLRHSGVVYMEGGRS